MRDVQANILRQMSHQGTKLSQLLHVWAVMDNRLDLLFADANPSGAFQCHSRFCLEPYGPDGISVEKNRARSSYLLERLEPEFGRFELEFELKGEENVAARRF